MTRIFHTLKLHFTNWQIGQRLCPAQAVTECVLSVGHHNTAYSPERAPSNIALTQVLMASSLLDQKTNLLLGLQAFLLIEVFAGQFVSHPLNNVKSLLVQRLWLDRFPTCSCAFTLPACHLLVVINKGFHV